MLLTISIIVLLTSKVFVEKYNQPVDYLLNYTTRLLAISYF